MSSASIKISRIITFLYNPIQHKCLYRNILLMSLISIHSQRAEDAEEDFGVVHGAVEVVGAWAAGVEENIISGAPSGRLDGCGPGWLWKRT